MPSTATITTFHSFSADTRARASQVNTNFSNFRGTIVPIEVLTATSSDNTYDLGSDEHRWRTVYTNTIDFETSTTTAGAVLRGDTAQTLGAFYFSLANSEIARIGRAGTTLESHTTTGAHTFRINAATKAIIDNNGLDGAYLKALSVDTAAIAAGAVTPAKRSTAVSGAATQGTTTLANSTAYCGVTVTGTGRPIMITFSSVDGTGQVGATITPTGASTTLTIRKAGSGIVQIQVATAIQTVTSASYLDTTGNVGSVTYDVFVAGENTLASGGIRLNVFEI